jgi:thiosulfate/3-mercaptopyruvate sulfurtransferase
VHPATNGVADSAAGPIVDANWLRGHRRDPDLRVIDVRPIGQYTLGHIPGAVSCDVGAIRMPDSSEPTIAAYVDAARAALRRAGVRAGDRNVVYEEFSGDTAARVVWLFDALGLGGASMLDGGLRAWVDAGGSLTRDIPPIAPSDLEVSFDRRLLATAGEILASLTGGAPMTILDTRSDGEYAAGTIPGAIHLEWIHHLRPDGSFRSLDELRALYEPITARLSPTRPVVAFCGSGYRSAHAYVVLTALGVPFVKNYAPSWGEWGRRPRLPVERPNQP